MTSGSGTGQTFAFDVQLTQSGSTLSGGNSGMVITGTVQGNTAQAQFVQPQLGYTGTFTWTMSGDGNAYGTFTSTAGNAGTSALIRR